jgi:FkbM family methyltransferase
VRDLLALVGSIPRPKAVSLLSQGVVEWQTSRGNPLQRLNPSLFGLEVCFGEVEHDWRLIGGVMNQTIVPLREEKVDKHRLRSRLARFVYSHRSLIKHFILVRRPVLLKLAHFKIYVRLDDMAVGAWIMAKHGYETHVTEVMCPFLKPGVVFVDIGANIGYYTLLAASRIGQEGKVIAFEPSDNNCVLLRRSLRANGFDNVELYPHAVADVERTVGLDMDFSNGQISLGDPLTSTYQVQAVTLDEFLKDEPRIDIIKMDIEGAEWLALQGMHQLIQRHRPAIFTEFHPVALETVSGITPELYLSQLRDLEYEVFLVRTDGQGYTRHSNDEIMKRLTRSGGTHLNLLTCPKEQTSST